MLKQITTALFLITIFSCGEKQKSARVEKKDTAIIKSKNKVESQPVLDDTQKVKVHHESFLEPIENLPSELTPFVPQGYSALDTVYGDLNHDAYTDLIMVLKQQHEDTCDVENPVKRPLLVLVGQADKTYKLAARNDNVVLCIACGGMMGDPFMRVVIKNGYFTVEHYGGSAWRWTKETTFKYSPADNDWLLNREEYGGSHMEESGQKTTTTIKTPKDFGKVPFEKYNGYKDE